MSLISAGSISLDSTFKSPPRYWGSNPTLRYRKLLFCLEVSAGGLTNYSMLSLYKTQFNVQRMKENKHILFYSILFFQLRSRIGGDSKG
jgi:hypothetical protein